jgi:methyl-accepting chemotaxis protein WspA
VALELANSQVFRVFNDYNGLGETGEAVVTVRSGQTFTLVAPPRHDPSMVTTFQGRIGDSKAIPMQRAVQGQRGYGESIDYRGEQVIAAWSYLPSFRWGMVVKQDVDEAFALINSQQKAIGLLFVVTLLVVTAVALWLARTITQPIREAATVTNRVASGDLTVTCEGRAPGEAGFRPSAR